MINNYSIINKNGRVNVFLFWDSECPLCANYERDIKVYKEQFKKDSIFFYKVYCNEFDFEKAIDRDQNIILDSSKNLVKALNGIVTPQAFAVSPEGEILYSGKIDNWIVSLGQKRQIVDSFYLKDALLAVINDKEIKISTTTPVGCFIER